VKRKNRLENKENKQAIKKIRMVNFIHNHLTYKISMENKQNMFVRKNTKKMENSCQSKDKKL